MSIKGKVALVVGASGAIGGAVARQFAKAGASIVLVYRSKSVTGLADEICSQGAACTSLPMDAASIASVTRVIQEIESAVGPIEVLVNASGAYGPIGAVEQNDPGHWAQALHDNVLGAFNLVHSVVPFMVARKRGRIIHFSGGGGAYGRAFFSSYSTCKAALLRFTECVAMELKDKGIYVNAIAPGPVKSTMWEELRAAGNVAGEAAICELKKVDKTGGVPADRAASLALVLAETSLPITGKLISAVWDDWENLEAHASALVNSDVWTLRRVQMEDKR